MRPPQCQNSRSVVGSVILFPTVRRAWNNLSQACARTAPLRRLTATRQPVQLRGVLPPLCIRQGTAPRFRLHITWDCPSSLLHPFLPSSLPPARHPKPPGLNLQHQLPTCALYALHASMNDVPSHVRQGPTFEHACTFVNVCVQRWLGGGTPCQQMSSCPHILARPRVLAASARRPSRAWRRARPAKTKTKPFSRRAPCSVHS